MNDIQIVTVDTIFEQSTYAKNVKNFVLKVR